MAEYIDKEALLRLVGRPPTITPTTAREDRLINAIISTIETFPAADVVEKERYDRLLENALIISAALQEYQKADVVEVVHGRWIIEDKYTDYRTERCSVCGFMANRTYIQERWFYCPHCGAKMDGGADNA